MDKHLVSGVAPYSQNPKPFPRHQWKRSLIELNGKFDPKYRHNLYHLLIQSYYEVGVFPHTYHIDGTLCTTHVSWIARNLVTKCGISALEFDKNGVYLVSVTEGGCLTVHDFETLSCLVNESPPRLEDEETKHLMHISLHQQLDAVRWNPANQDEVACISLKSSEIYIFDIGYIRSEPIEVLRMRPSVSLNGCRGYKGLSDIAFSSDDYSSVFASDIYGAIGVWDRRINHLPCLQLTTNSNGALNSIKLDVANQTIFGASKQGIIYVWDLRGGRSSSAFQSHKEVCYSPLASIKLASKLEKIGSLKAQSNIVTKEIHSIDFNPSCPYQLAFHLDDGWSGVMDVHSFEVTHIHCPPPVWLDDDQYTVTNLSQLRKPSWLSAHSIYAVGSSSQNGVYLLDFYPDPSSPCHVDFEEEEQSILGASPHNQNRFVPLSEGVIACTSHPLNGSIVAGTKYSSLLVISQGHKPCQDGDNR